MNLVDPDGKVPQAVVGGLIGGIVGGGASIISDLWHGRKVGWARAGKSAVRGAIAGASTAATLGLATPATAALTRQALSFGAGRVTAHVAANAVVGTGGATAGDVAAQGLGLGVGWQQCFSWQELGWSTALGGVFGGVSGGFAAAKRGTAFESMMGKVGTLDFSTPANKAIFYSGPGQGARAAAFAERTEV